MKAANWLQQIYKSTGKYQTTICSTAVFEATKNPVKSANSKLKHAQVWSQILPDV